MMILIKHNINNCLRLCNLVNRTIYKYNPGRVQFSSYSINPVQSGSYQIQNKFERCFTSAYRLYSNNNDITPQELKNKIQDISTEFTEAMELMSDARSSVGTVYFSDDVEDARLQVGDTLQMYQDLLSELSKEQVREVTQVIGLKMEELKAQMDLIEELAKSE